MRRFMGRLCLGLLSATAGLYPAFSDTMIQYEVTDLGDNVPTQDRWEYRYFVSGFTFAANQGFTIWFDQSLFAQLETPLPPNPQWDVLVLQPDLALPDSGAFDALALLSTPSLALPFAVDFVSLAGTPGSQLFDINQFDSQGNLVQVIESGVTVPRQSGTVPEPGTLWLIAGEGACLALWKRAGSRKQI
jgi:hypothetical protein